MTRQRTDTPQHHLRGGEKVDKGAGEFIDPFSYESKAEARVQLELENRHIPFSYRYFDGSAPTLKTLIPAYAPEFTMKEYHIVIVVVGGFYGTLPGAIDEIALASVLLQKDGWKQIAWQENEITNIGVASLITRDIPEFVNPAIIGVERPSPVGHPLTMETRRQWLRGLALLKKIFTPKTAEAAGGRSVGVRRKFIHRQRSDTGRLRSYGARALKDTD